MGPKGRFLLVFAVHLAVQGTFLVHVPERFVRPHARWEVNAVAMSLHERGTFADPYAVPTGPTAHRSRCSNRAPSGATSIACFPARRSSPRT